MQDEEIRQTINRFPRWHYQFDLSGNLTPISDETRINRHKQRKKYFFDPVVGLSGGSLRGRRVLDLGCNAGFWSLCAVENGCDFVLGIDGRQMHIDQANFVFQVKEIEKSKYQFMLGNVLEVDFQQLGNFDIVLCLGLLYHVSKPMVLMERVSQVNSDVLVIDTQLSGASGSYLELRHDNLDDPRDAVECQLVMVPTKQAVVDMARQLGYAAVVLKPGFQDYAGCEGYELGTRRAFLCVKKTDISDLPVEAEPIDLCAKRPGGVHTPVRRAGVLSRCVSKFLRKYPQPLKKQC